MTSVRSKSENLQIYYGHSMEKKYAGSKAFFRHESEMGHAIEPFTIVAYVHRQLLHKKKDVVYGLLFCYMTSQILDSSRTLLENPNLTQKNL